MMNETITPNSRMSLRDFINSRYVIKQFALRDIKVRYINSYLGYLWAVFNPLFNALIYITVFGFLVRVKTPEYLTSYSVVLLLGLLVWNLFLQSAEQSSNVLIGNMHLIKKVYFPRISLCIASAATASIDFLIALSVTVVIFLGGGFEGFTISTNLLLLPLIFFGILLLGLSLGAFLAILKVKYQDVKHVVPLLFQTLFFISPIVYTQSLVPKDWLFLFQFNPLYGYISTFRWMFIENAPFTLGWLIYSLTFSSIFFVYAVYFFSKYERQIVDSE